MKINIIGTGSDGNCIIFDDKIMIDAGLPFKKISDHVGSVSTVLLTHEHGDHYRADTVSKLFLNNERIKFCGNGTMCKLLKNIGIPQENIIFVNAGEVYRGDGVIFSPVNLYHDVENYGYRLIKGDYKHFHATDTFSLDGITARNYDSATIEANHCIDAANEIIEASKAGGEFSHLVRTIKTHLSVDKAIKFIDDNSIENFIPVHMGKSTADSVIKKIRAYLLSKFNKSHGTSMSREA